LEKRGDGSMEILMNGSELSRRFRPATGLILAINKAKIGILPFSIRVG
jgi:hypothetical protein